MAITAARFYRNPSNSTARGLFRASLLYLPVFMAGLVIHRTPERRLGIAAAAEAESAEADSAHSSTAGSPEERSSDSDRTPQHGRAQRQPPFAPPFPLLPLPHRD